MSKNEKFLSVIESLGEIIVKKDLDISLLKYENERLKEKINSIEEHIDSYVND